MRTSVKKKHSISVEIPHYQRPRHANLGKKKKIPLPPKPFTEIRARAV